MDSGRLKNKNVLLGITGSIAAYKACDILRLLKKEGADIQVVMTMSAQRFVHPMTFETLSGHEAIRELFPANRAVNTLHISVADWAHCLLICPATANIIGKIASGIADDFLSTVVMAARSPVLLAPAMDPQMVRNPIYTQNCDKLKSLGYRFIDPGEGELASGKTGPGRLAEKVQILDAVKHTLLGTDSLKGQRVLVTAGPTQESIDPVRFLSNRSSGKMGFAVAEEAKLRGADVTLVSGPVALEPFSGIRWIRVKTAGDMLEAVQKEWENHHVLVMAAAVADYRPEAVLDRKMKKESDSLSLKLQKTADILAEMSKTKGNRITVGFALETENGETHALEKLKNKGADLVCLNGPSAFDAETNQITLIDSVQQKTALPPVPKWRAAQLIWDRIEWLMKRRVR